MNDPTLNTMNPTAADAADFTSFFHDATGGFTSAQRCRFQLAVPKGHRPQGPMEAPVIMSRSERVTCSVTDVVQARPV
jgi:hypothetical protein